jgi:hypothetical protein
MVLSLRLVFLLLLLPMAMLAVRQTQTTENGQRILSVGPGKMFMRPSQAAAVAAHGDTVEISAGEYAGDAAVWRANNLTIRGVGGRPHLKANGAHAQGKAIWVISGNNTVVENIEFSGAKVPDGNGAAIRQEGSRLTLRNCYIHDNEMGILAGNEESDVVIEGSELSDSSGGYNHNIYMGNIRSFTLRYSYVHHAMEGHNVKTRARTNFILYNRIMDETTGRSSYAIDVPNGGRTYVIGNVIQKGTKAENTTVIAYGAEGATNEVQEFYLINNTIVSNFGRGRFLGIFGRPSTLLINNIFTGRGLTAPDVPSSTPNLISLDPLFRDPLRFDYRLKRGSPAIDAGINPGTAKGFNLVPEFEYVHPLGHQARSASRAIDIGAYEYGE